MKTLKKLTEFKKFELKKEEKVTLQGGDSIKKKYEKWKAGYYA